MNSARSIRRGHMLALFSILVWGTTFISTTILLRDFKPAEILFFRVVLAISALGLARPKRLFIKEKRHHLYFAGAGLCGVTLYFLLENIALTHTYSANCSVILSTAPFFVALASYWFLNGERLNRWFFIGFLAALLGVAFISFSGQALQLNPLGDLLCIGAAVSWAAYSVFIKKIDIHGYDTLLVTRRIFAFGLLFLLPCLLFVDFSPNWQALANPTNLLNFLYLGLCASALCFVTWNVSVKVLGAVKTSIYIYVSPAITIAAANIILQDPILPLAIAGAFLTLLGLLLSQKGSHRV